nr:cytochrome c oxidase subunit II [Gloeothece citriformis]
MSLYRWLMLIALALVLAIISLGIGKLSYSWLPPQASAESQLIDNLFSFLVTLGSFIFLGVTGTVLYSIFFQQASKYDSSDGPHIEGNITLEVIWTAIPILLVVWIATYSYQIYIDMNIQTGMGLGHIHLPIKMESAMAAPMTNGSEEVENIDVQAKQWAWVFNYPEQGVSSTELHLPSDRRIRLTLKSEDVIHGFYIPAFRIKQDAIPGRTIQVEFTPIRQGKYRLRDSQFSGTYFATMQANVVVQSPEDYQKWLKTSSKLKPTVAENEAASEYAQEVKASFKTGWPSIAPANPPVVNYHN